MTLIIRTEKDIADYVAKSPVVVACKQSYEEDVPGSFAEIWEELITLIASGGSFENRPSFGEDWESWLSVHVEELLQEAVDIVT